MGAVLKAIPRKLMPSTMSVRLRTEGKYGEAWGEPAEIRHVRFQSYDVKLAEAYKLQDGSKGLVYVDAVNSDGAFEVPQGSLVSIDGGEPMQVVRCTRLEGYFGQTHHWELEVA